jgi:hypothetical protein
MPTLKQIRETTDRFFRDYWTEKAARDLHWSDAIPVDRVEEIPQFSEAGCYALIYYGKVRYVGLAEGGVIYRIRDHQKRGRIQFNACAMIPKGNAHYAMLCGLERFLIYECEPPDNQR